MIKLKENKIVWIIVSVIVVAFVVFLLANQYRKNVDEQGETSDKSRQETVIENNEPEDSSKTGLEVSDPEQAGSENKVEFVDPDGSKNNIGSESGGTTNNGDSIEETDDSKKTGDLDEESDDNEKYGGFF